jgi:hypothetical protein
MKQGELPDVRLVSHHNEGVIVEKQLAADICPATLSTLSIRDHEADVLARSSRSQVLRSVEALVH